MFPEFDVEWSVFQYVLISLALGAIVGLERQAQSGDEDRVRNGIRTFALSSLLGTVAALLHPIGPVLAAIVGIGFLALVVSYYVLDARFKGVATGITTETAAFVVFALGALVPSRPLLAASIAVIVALILSQKKRIHRSVRRMTSTELFATIKLLLVTLVFLPLLPNQPVDPWGIYVPRDIWFLVVLISAISFVGYFAMRVFGSHRGIAITGIVGGLASSTAVTLAMAQRAREQSQTSVVRAAAFAIVAANAIMLLRVYVEITVVDPALAAPAAPAIGAMCGASAFSAVLLWLFAGRGRIESAESAESKEEGEHPEMLDNPFRIGPALKFGAVFIVIIGVAHVARGIWGTEGLYMASLAGGLADADATVLTAARLHETQVIEPSTAVRAIMLAAASNSLVKAGLAGVLGSRQLGLLVLVAMLPLIATTVAIWFVF